MGDNPPSADDTKVCPYCAETIKQAAIVCRYCGRDLPADKLAQPAAPTVRPVDPSIYGTLEVPVARREIPGQERPKFVAGTPVVPGGSASVLQSYKAPIPEEKHGWTVGGCLKFIFVIFGLLILVAFASMLFNGSRPTTTSGSYVALPTPTMTAAQLDKAAEAIPWDSLARDTESYVGKLMSGTGTVIQVLETSGGAQMRVNLDDDFDKTVFVEYPGYDNARVLQGDKVRMIARVEGRISYDSIFGQKITLPGLTVLSLTVLQK